MKHSDVMAHEMRFSELIDRGNPATRIGNRKSCGFSVRVSVYEKAIALQVGNHDTRAPFTFTSEARSRHNAEIPQQRSERLHATPMVKAVALKMLETALTMIMKPM